MLSLHWQDLRGEPGTASPAAQSRVRSAQLWQSLIPARAASSCLPLLTLSGHSSQCSGITPAVLGGGLGETGAAVCKAKALPLCHCSGLQLPFLLAQDQELVPWWQGGLDAGVEDGEGRAEAR